MILQSTHGADAKRADIAYRYYIIAAAYKGQNKYKEALENALKSLDILKVIHGTDTQHPDTARVYVLIGDIYTCTGEYTLALKNFRDGLKMWIAISGTELMNNKVGECDQRISNIHKRLGNLYSAEYTDTRIS